MAVATQVFDALVVGGGGAGHGHVVKHELAAIHVEGAATGF